MNSNTPIPIRIMERIEQRWLDYREWEQTTTIDEQCKTAIIAAITYRAGFFRAMPWDVAVLIPAATALTVVVAIRGAFAMMKEFTRNCRRPSLPFTPQVVPALALPFMGLMMLCDTNVARLFVVAVSVVVVALSAGVRSLVVTQKRTRVSRVDVVKEVRA